MTNKEIAAQFKLLTNLMELHGETSFRVRSYQNAVRVIEKNARDIAEVPEAELQEIPGIGKAVSQKIMELLSTGHISVLDSFLEKTPAGIVEMLSVKGLGPKKVDVIWRELGVESLGELLYACEENRLMLLKGFGQKTQDNIRDAILFFMDQAGQFLFAQVETLGIELNHLLAENLPPGQRLQLIGQLPRQMPIIDRIEWVTTLNESGIRRLFELPALAQAYAQASFRLETLEEDPVMAQHLTRLNEAAVQVLVVSSPKLPVLRFILVPCSDLTVFNFIAFLQNCSSGFKSALCDQFGRRIDELSWEEEKVFEELSMAYIPIAQRECPLVIQEAISGALPDAIKVEDVKGVIHCHSRYSDGGQTLKEMALAARDKGFEYLMISDHSKSAGYAGGLKPERILEQHAEIDALNKSLAPFKVFKGIESDILRNGALDYDDEVLASFDLVIASVHSVLKMDIEDATARLIKAIENPYTRILGHMTGRLLLSRKGYPLDVERVLDACKANNVVVELNANPRRLDIDWTLIHKVLDRGLLISINPDAHSVRGIDDIRYGVLVAQKAGVTASQNFSSLNLSEMQQYLTENKKV